MSALRPIAIQYTCRNPGQTALLWAWQPAPFGHGWIDVKAEPLVRLSEVEALVRDIHMIAPGQPGRGDISREQRTWADVKRFLDSQQVTK